MNVLVDCTETPVRTESDRGASVFRDWQSGGGLTVCTSEVTPGGILIGILPDDATLPSVVVLTGEDALWFGRKVVDLANQ